jgi:aminoglycoside phosphotransferase (APT) family kinase protein
LQFSVPSTQYQRLLDFPLPECNCCSLKLSPDTQDWIESAAHGSVIAVTAMSGATSSVLHSIDVRNADGVRSLLLRRFTDREWTKREPDVAIREARSLQHATRAGLPAPELVAVDAKGEHCGVPATLVSVLAGNVSLEPTNYELWLDGLANAAAQIHRVDAGGFPWKYRRYNDAEPLAVPRWSREPDAWKRAIDIVNGSQPSFRECFIHRDYHPSNVLWHDGAVSGVVDWVNGCRGPAGIDVAWCRHNLANLHSVGVADDFLAAYIRRTGADFEYDPYWDLMTVVEMLPGPPAMYEGWRAMGVKHIPNAIILERLDAYVASVVDRL